MKVKMWHISPGDRMGIHGHPSQEEFSYVLDGPFPVYIGPSGETDSQQAGPGAVVAASPEVARGYENIGKEPAGMRTGAAPSVPEARIPEH